MKKLLSLLLVAFFIFGLAACDGEVEEKDYTDFTLTVYFVPSRPANEIFTMTAPLEQMLLDELELAGYDIAGVDILVSSSYEAAGIAMLSGTGDVGFLPGGTYVMFADVPDSPVEVILSAARDGLQKDSLVAIDWNDGLATAPIDSQVNYYKGLIVAGPSVAGREVAAKVNAGDTLVWDDVKDLKWCVSSQSSSSGYIYPNLWVYENFDGKLYKIHESRVIAMSSLPSAQQRMYGVGFSALSRCINYAQVLTDILIYKQEKLGSRPKERLIVGRRGITAEDIARAFMVADDQMNSMGLTRYSKTVVVAPNVRTSSAEIDISVEDLVDAGQIFDEGQSLMLGMNTIALALGVPTRWLWPATATGATKAEIDSFDRKNNEAWYLSNFVAYRYEHHSLRLKDAKKEVTIKKKSQCA